MQCISQWPALFFMLILAVSLLFPVVGIHPFVTIGVIGIFLQPVLQVAHPLSVAVVLISCSICAAFVGTFNTTGTIMSGLLQMNPYRIAMWNMAFAIFVGGLGVILGLMLL